MGAPWVVHEGYVLVRPPPQQQQQRHQPPPGSSPTRTGAALHALVPNGLHTQKTKLMERYVVIYMNRKLEFYEAATATPASAAENDASGTIDRRRVGDALYVSAFAGWDGDGLLKVGESYGLELKVDRKPHASGRNTTSLYIAAFNRVDLEKWCRALVAVLDPQSAAGEDVRREHRRERKEAKRLELEREEKIRKWRELKLKQIEDERERMLAREEEISNMTPLERVDGLGSLDDDTARLLEKRKLRLQKRHAPTTGRVTKTAYRKRIEDGAGGKLENVQPLQPKVVETKARVRVELPLPGQFIEAAGVSSTHRIGLPHSSDRARVGSLSSSSGSSSHEHPSDTSSSVSSNSNSHSSAGHVPPPPPPPPHALMMMMTQSRETSLRASFVPPPPPPRSGSGFVDLHRHDTTNRASRTGSVRGSLYDTSDDFDNFDSTADRRSDVTRASFSQSRRRLSGVEREKMGIQDSLAAILSGRPSARRDSIDSTTSGFSVAKASKKTKSTLSTEPPMANAFAASLAAIRRNRADTMDDTSAGSTDSQPVPTSTTVRSRTRKSQLSAEAKELLQKAIGDRASDARTSTTATTASKTTGGRKGLFDDSSSDDDDSSGGLFATTGKARRTSNGTKQQRNGTMNGKQPDRRSSTTPTSSRGSSVDPHRPTNRGFDDHDDSDSDVTDASRSENGTNLFATKPQTASPLSTASFNSTTSSVPTVSVAYVTSVVQTEGKKPAGFYTFALRVAGARDHSVTLSYSELEAIHLRLSGEWSTTRATDAMPKFPPKHRLRNNTKPENMHKRALELLAYLQQLVALPHMVTHPRFVFEFRIDDAFAKCLRGESAASGASDVSGHAHVLVSPVQTTAANGTSPTPRRRTSNGKPAVKQSLFDVASENSDDDSDSDASVVPPSRVQPRRSDVTAGGRRDDDDAPRASRTMKASKRADKKASEPVATSRRRPSSAASRAPTESSSVPVPVPVPTSSNGPSITGLPPRPNLFANGRGDLLAAIRQGAALKKVETSDSTATTSVSGSTARPTAAAAAPTLAPVGSIADAITNAMASRRIHVEYEDAHSDDDADSDDDWD